MTQDISAAGLMQPGRYRAALNIQPLRSYREGHTAGLFMDSF